MNVFAVGSKNRTTSNKPPHNGESGFQNRQTERNHRYRHRQQGRSLVSALESEGAQHKSDKKTAAISQKDCGGTEIKTEKAEKRSCQRQRHERNRRRTRDQGRGEHNHRRKKSGTGSQSVQSVNQVEGIVMARTHNTVIGSPTNQGNR